MSALGQRFAQGALVALIIGLPFHNYVMASLYGEGLDGGALDVVAAWKDVLLAGAIGAALLAGARYGRLRLVDWLALAYAGFVVLYALLPQSWLDGEATARGELLALRHHLLPLGGYALGRLLVVDRAWLERMAALVLGVAAIVAVWGLVEVYTVSLETWRTSGVPGWFGTQLGLSFECLVLPENWILNTGDETEPLRRLVGPFLTPLATAYLIVVALLGLASVRRRPPPIAVGLGLLAAAGLLWTHTRAALLALAGGLVVLALVRRSLRVGAAAAAAVVVAFGFVSVFPTLAPTTSYTAAELACLRDNAATTGGDTNEDAARLDDDSTRSHLRNLRAGLETVVRHPQGYGLGNAGVVASRTLDPGEIKAGESTYTELGVDLGVAGLAAFVAWMVALLVGLWRRSAWLTATLAAILAIGLQTDVIGVHWLSVVVFALAGAAVRTASGALDVRELSNPARAV